MKAWIIVFLFINAANSIDNSTSAYSAITVKRTTQYSADIELFDKEHGFFISFVKCNGTHTYTDEYRAITREKSLIKENFPNGNTRVWISDLIPNGNYNCVVVLKDTANRKRLSSVTFSTKYGAPIPPPAPEITAETSNNQLVVTILLQPSSTKLSPISGYKLQFYVVEPDADGIPVVSNQRKPLGLIPSLEKARSSKAPTDFVYQTYDAASLPYTVIVQPSVLLGAFRHNYSYSAVLSAYRNASEGYEYEYATSKFSIAFKIVYVSEVDKYDFRTKYARNVAGIVLGGVVPILLCLSAIALLTLWCKYRKKKSIKTRFQKKKQDKFKYPVFDAGTGRKSLFSIKSPSPQYQPHKDLSPSQLNKQPTDMTSHGMMDKGMDMLRRTSITLANALSNFRTSLRQYSWISDVDNLIIDEEKEDFTESDEFVDAKEIAGSSSNIKKIDIENSEDPERVVGSVITLSSTPVVKSRSKSHIPLEEPLQEIPL